VIVLTCWPYEYVEMFVGGKIVCPGIKEKGNNWQITEK
jgi:hypothetical protein